MGSFDYGKYFPNSSRVRRMQLPGSQAAGATAAPTFAQFADVWFAEKRIEWRESTRIGVQGALDKYLLPFFGAKPVSDIGRNDIMQFRAELASRQVNGRHDQRQPGEPHPVGFEDDPRRGRRALRLCLAPGATSGACAAAPSR